MSLQQIILSKIGICSVWQDPLEAEIRKNLYTFNNRNLITNLNSNNITSLKIFHSFFSSNYFFSAISDLKNVFNSGIRNFPTNEVFKKRILSSIRPYDNSIFGLSCCASLTEYNRLLLTLIKIQYARATEYLSQKQNLLHCITETNPAAKC